VKRRRAGLAVVCAFLAVALILLLWGSDREPRCQGKPLSEWLLQEAWKHAGLTADQEEAVRCMGTNALPFLLKWVQYVTPPWRVRLTSNAPRFVGPFWFLLGDQQMERARLSVMCLRVLGPDVSPAMPELVKMMKQTNAVVAIRALQVVDSAGLAGIPVLLDVLTNRQAYNQDGAFGVAGTMGQLGIDGHFAVPALLTCLTNKDASVASIAAALLGTIRLKPQTVVPALIGCLDAPDVRVRYAAVRALAEFRTYAQVAIPSVVRELSDPDGAIRAQATNSLYLIEMDFHGQRGAHEQRF
jgi:hypothetical protein